MNGRRTFLQMFGLTAAGFAGSKGIEVETDESVKPLHVDLPGVGPHAPPILADRGPLAYCMDVQKGRLYSAADFISTESRIQFFHYRVGLLYPFDNRTATSADTNMWMEMALPAPQCFAVQRVGVVFSPLCDGRDRARFIDCSSVKLWIGQKSYFHRPLAEMFGVGDPAENLPDKALVDLDPLPLILQTQQMFYAEIETAPHEYSERLRLWVVYDGLDARGVA